MNERLTTVSLVLLVLLAGGCDPRKGSGPQPMMRPAVRPPTPVPEQRDESPAVPAVATQPHPALPSSSEPTTNQLPVDPPIDLPIDLPIDSLGSANSTSEPSPVSAEEQALADVGVEVLVEKLATAAERDAASRVLVRRGAAAIEPLTAALMSDDAQVRAAAAFTLGQLGEDAAPAISQLKQLAGGDESPTVRDAAAFALGALEQP